MQDNNLNEVFQSAYKCYHSMETALTKVHDDILRSIDNKCSMVLLLLDLSAVFDTVDRNTLLERLSQRLNSALLLIDFLKNQLLL